MNTVAFYTLGCKVNQYESEAMAELFERAGYTISDFDSICDIYVINTCTVTGMSDRKSRKIIRQAKKKNPDSIVIVTGCYAQTAPDEIKKIDGVNLIIGTNNRSKIVSLAESIRPGEVSEYVSDIMSDRTFEQLLVTGYSNRSRAYIKIQEGCNQFCTYCIIPYARGPVRSRDRSDILEEVKLLSQNGFKEVILTGIHIASYRGGDGYTLAELICDINKVPGIQRIRLGSLEPMTLNAKFIEKIKNCDKLCHHFHLALQSGCDETLKRMNRKYNTDGFRKIVHAIRGFFPDAAITTDIMVGFPEETDEEFEKTVKFIEEIEFSDSHIFEYSVREGTPAADMKQIPPETKHLRSKRAEQITAASHSDFLKAQLGKTVPVLIEQCISDDIYEGKTDNYVTVQLKSEIDVTDEIVDVYLCSIKNGIIIGEI